MNFIEFNSALFLGMAYLDPGSGSILIQMIIGALVGAGFYIRAKWGSIKNIFRKNLPKTEENDIEDQDFDV
ncbi:MAG: hypothetical protein ABFS17_13530 [Chloroflexota bacterium]